MVKKNKKNILQAFLGSIILVSAVLGLTAFILHFTDKKDCYTEKYTPENTKDVPPVGPGEYCANCTPGMGSTGGDSSCTYMTDWLSHRGIDCSGPEGSVCTFSGKFIGDLSGNINGNLNGNVNGDISGNLTGTCGGGVAPAPGPGGGVQYYQTPFLIKSPSTTYCSTTPGYRSIPRQSELSDSAKAYLNFISGPGESSTSFEHFCFNLVSLDASSEVAIIERLPWPVGDCIRDGEGRISCPH